MDEGYYLRATVSYTDGHGSDKTAMAMTDNMVTTVQDQPGTVTLSPMEPVIGTPVTAMLTDSDGMVTGEMWQWTRSMDMTTWDDIADATDASYTPVAMDEGYYLRATVSYTDGHGSDKTAMANDGQQGDDGQHGDHRPGPGGDGHPVDDAAHGWHRANGQP
jgi:hypothetical protein